MAARSVVRCGANLLRSAVTQSARRTKIDGLSVGGSIKSNKFLNVQSNSLLINSNLAKSSLRTYTTAIAAAAQLQATASPLCLLGNVDIRSLSSGPSSSLSEEEDDDEQNCPPHSGIICRVQDEMLKGENSGQIFAVVYIGGSQFKITVNDTIVINRIDADTGDRIRIEKVLLVGGENFTVIGTPLLARDLAMIEATVVEKTKAPKVTVFKKKRRKGYKRTQGHRQDITVLRINCIQVQPSLLSSSL